MLELFVSLVNRRNTLEEQIVNDTELRYAEVMQAVTVIQENIETILGSEHSLVLSWPNPGASYSDAAQGVAFVFSLQKAEICCNFAHRTGISFEDIFGGTFNPSRYHRGILKDEGNIYSFDQLKELSPHLMHCVHAHFFTNLQVYLRNVVQVRIGKASAVLQASSGSLNEFRQLLLSLTEMTTLSRDTEQGENDHV